jgi:flagella basal body P-ring formation protein FlgA
LTARTVDILKEFNPPIAADQDLSGFELAQAVQAGKPISRRDLVERSLVRKGQFVDAVANEGGLNIRMRAQAMEAGPAGAVIRVRNLDSQKVFFAQVINENQVQVRF